MRINYHTGIATLVQLLAMTVLGIVNGFESVITTCNARDGDCMGNTFATVIFFVVTTTWFAAIWVLGSITQYQRSRKLAYLLIAVEFAVLTVALFNFSQPSTLISSLTSLLDSLLAVWVIILAFRLSRAKGGRIVAGARRRRRRTQSDNT